MRTPSGRKGVGRTYMTLVLLALVGMIVVLLLLLITAVGSESGPVATPP